MELTVHQRRQLLFKAFKLMDVVWMMVSLAATVAVVTYRKSEISLPELLAVRLKITNVLLLLGLAVLWHLIFSSLGLYRSRRLRSRRSEIFDVVKATSLGSLALLNAGILFRIELFSPELLALFWATSTGLTVLGRLAVRLVLEKARLRGRNLRNVLVVGTNLRAWKYAQKIAQRPELGYRLLGFVDDEWGGLEEFRQRGGRLVSGIDGLLGFLRRQVVDEVVIAPRTLGDGSTWDIAFGRDSAQTFMYVADGKNMKVYIILRESLEVLTSFGDGGRQPGQFFAVHSIATDSQGNIYTTETYEGKRVQKFVYKGMGPVPARDQGVVWPGR